jgi:hypothetical protein
LGFAKNWIIRIPKVIVKVKVINIGVSLNLKVRVGRGHKLGHDRLQLQWVAHGNNNDVVLRCFYIILSRNESGCSRECSRVGDATSVDVKLLV